MIKINSVRANLNLDQWKPIGGIEGRNSEVWIARDTQLDQVLILKKISKESLKKQNIDDYFIEAKILNEAKHPHIMPIHYAAEDEKSIFITMPYYSNGSLNKMMDERFLTAREIIKYSLDFLSGLLYIHIKDFVHLDIKPTNVIINDTDRAILTDFGLSKFLDEDGTAEQSMHYIAHASPEYSITSIRTVQDDIYQAGITLYRMCNGNVDFYRQFQNFELLCKDDHEKRALLIGKGAFPDRSKYLPHIPKKLRKIINRMLDIDLDKRYKDVLEIINDLSTLEDHLDWEYNIIKEGQEYEWKLNQETSVLSVRIAQNNSVYLTSGFKYVKKSGNIQNVNKYKQTHENLDAARKFIEKNLFR